MKTFYYGDNYMRKNIKSCLFVTLILAGFIAPSSQVDAINLLEWGRLYDVPEAKSVSQTSDGGYIMTGGTTNVYLLKTDANGVQQWLRTYTEMRNPYSRQGSSVQQTLDGGYIVGLSGGWDSWDETGLPSLIKTSSDGTLQWERSYGNGIDFKSVIQCSDGSYVAVGTWNDGTGSWPGIVLKADEDGNELWRGAYDYFWEGDWQVGGVCQTSDGGYVVAGCDYLEGAGAQLVKLDSWGQLQWSTVFSGMTVTDVNSVHQLSSGGYAVAGYTERLFYGDDCKSEYVGCGFLAVFDGDGHLLWTRYFEDMDTLEGRGGVLDIDVTDDGGFILCGRIGSNGGLIKTDGEGDTLWTMTLGEGILMSVRETSERYVAAGSSGGSAWLVKVLENPARAR